jgi:hypothetical protein
MCLTCTDPRSPPKTGTDLMFGSVPDFQSPVLLDRHGSLRNSSKAIVLITCSGRVSAVLREKARLAQCSTVDPASLLENS